MTPWNMDTVIPGQYTPVTQGARLPVGPRILAWCDRHRRAILPGIATTTLTACARVWHHTGAAGDLSTLAILGGAGILGFGGAYVSATGRHGSVAITTAGATTGATCAVAAVTAYADPWQPGALLWAIGTTAASIAYSRTPSHQTTQARTADTPTYAELAPAPREMRPAHGADAAATTALLEAITHRLALGTTPRATAALPRIEAEILDAEIVTPTSIAPADTEPPAFG
ncbi:hypothetical protein [Embleya sp. NPDC005575]|uniref:hypothetical protein n=1 Tax=Embleya sp. NPDC005575 TaxID=3156892 RepID=UPI00339E2DC0